MSVPLFSHLDFDEDCDRNVYKALGQAHNEGRFIFIKKKINFICLQYASIFSVKCDR